MKVYAIKKNTGFNSFEETSVKLSQAIQDSGLNERMRGFGHSTISKLVYRGANIKYEKQKSGSFRSTLDIEDLKKVIELEDKVIELLIIDPDIKYEQIKQELLKEVR